MDRILIASYGDKGQRKKNHQKPNKDAAKALLIAHKERKILNPAQPDPDKQEPKAYRRVK